MINIVNHNMNYVVRGIKFNWKPLVLSCSLGTNWGLDYYNNNVLGKVRLPFIHEGCTPNSHVFYGCGHETGGGVEDYLLSPMLSCLFGGLSVPMKLKITYDNYNDNQSYKKGEYRIKGCLCGELK